MTELVRACRGLSWLIGARRGSSGFVGASWGSLGSAGILDLRDFKVTPVPPRHVKVDISSIRNSWYSDIDNLRRRA